MDRQSVYEEMFAYAKTYIEAQSEYNVKVLKSAPRETNIFPLIVIPQCKMVLKDETLSHGEKEYRLIFDIEIYTIDKKNNTSTIARQTIMSELQKLICDVFEDYYIMKLSEPKDRPNIDRNVNRQYIRADATINENKKIFRR